VHPSSCGGKIPGQIYCVGMFSWVMGDAKIGPDTLADALADALTVVGEGDGTLRCSLSCS